MDSGGDGDAGRRGTAPFSRESTTESKIDQARLTGVKASGSHLLEQNGGESGALLCGSCRLKVIDRYPLDFARVERRREVLFPLSRFTNCHSPLQVLFEANGRPLHNSCWDLDAERHRI